MVSARLDRLARARTLALGAAFAGCVSANARTQGQWVLAFDHQHAVAGVASDARAPFQYPGGPEWPTRLAAPDATTPPVPRATMNAIHMVLIPAGPHRGKVLVWDRGPLLGFASPFPPAGHLWSFQAYAIVDAALAPDGLRFHNFFLPLDATPWPPPSPAPVPRDLFCAGHAWAPAGHLVVAGGTRYVAGQPDNAADLVYTFDPRAGNAPFPSTPGGAPLYTDAGSRWTRESLVLTAPRYYPTVTLTHRLPREIDGERTLVEAMLVSGGSAVGSQPSPQWNSYEALLPAAPSTSGPRVRRDAPRGAASWWGPSDPDVEPYDPFRDALLEYPRLHLLSNGNVFLSGYAPVSAQVDHSFAPGTLMPARWGGAWTQRWNQEAGVPPPGAHAREEGASVLIVNGTGVPDLVVRIAGELEHVATRSVEACVASLPGPWLGAAQGVPQLAFPREHPNAVVLPDLSIVVFGGHAGQRDVLWPEVLQVGEGGWQVQLPARSPRNYHATAVLLPSGHVLVAGGNDRHPTPQSGFDYELWAPGYLCGDPPPDRPSGVAIGGAARVHADGTFELARGATFRVSAAHVPAGTTLAKLVLMAPGACTHHSDMHARYVECPVVAVTVAGLTPVPPTERPAPRGYYMAFAVTGTRVPAEAVWVWLD